MSLPYRLVSDTFYQFKNELKSAKLWIEVFAEFLVTTLFISFVCGCSLSWNPPSSVMHMAISSGLGVATFAFTMWDVSSGLFNPALTIAFFIAHKKTLAQTILYIVAQLIGGRVKYTIFVTVLLRDVTQKCFWQRCCKRGSYDFSKRF